MKLRHINKLLNKWGFNIARIVPEALPGSSGRPVGNMYTLLQDLAARGIDCKSILDVGANKGHWSLMAKTVFPHAKFLLIEPQLEMEAALQSICSQNPQMQFVLAGAGPENTEMVLTIWKDLLGSSLLPPPEQALQISGQQRTIPIVTIDSLLQQMQFPLPELVKMDIQGFELEALKGATTLIGFTEVFILEVSLIPFDNHPNLPLLWDVVQFMHQNGYVVYDFAGFGRRPYDGALGQCDICFVKANGKLRNSNAWS
jgi:FkbM family methyltransferase